jgi:hypothetical protein
VEAKRKAKHFLRVMSHSMQKVSEIADSTMMNASEALGVVGVDFDDEDLVMLESDCYDIKFRAEACAKFLKEKAK